MEQAGHGSGLADGSPDSACPALARTGRQMPPGALMWCCREYVKSDSTRIKRGGEFDMEDNFSAAKRG
ncbi:MAG: hypothetical protein KBG46_13970, partial [Paracoccus sp.]|nr:hypothetical protein [Paracoccus sp. (in: a-proteobacteria)]